MDNQFKTQLLIDDFQELCTRKKSWIYDENSIYYVQQMALNRDKLKQEFNCLQEKYGEYINYDCTKHRFPNIVDSKTFNNTTMNILHDSSENLTSSGQFASTLTGPNELTRTNSNLTGAKYSICNKTCMATQQPIDFKENYVSTTNDFLSEGFLYGNNGDCQLVINLNNYEHSRNYLVKNSTLFDLITISNYKISVNLSIEYFNLHEKNSPKFRTMIVIHYTGWPDFGVPDSPLEFCKMFVVIQNFLPIVSFVMVHCRAGVGRTGTLLAMMKYHDVLLQSKCPNLVKIIKELRHGRPLMVQLSSQFDFIITCMNYIIDNDI